MERISRALTIAALLLVACGIPESKRCPDGFYYEEESQTCLPVDTSDTGGIDTSTGDGPDASVDGGAGDAGGDDGVHYGQPCTTQEDCAAYTVTNYCAGPPFIEEGYCTSTGCTGPADCPSGWKCCDCTAVQYPIACAGDAEAEMLSGICQCL